MRRVDPSFLVAICLAALLAPLPARADARIEVVATFTILADFVRNVGGDRVAVATLVGPGGDAHVYTPSPADAKAVAAAKLVVVNGLGLEGWLPRLVKSSGGTARTVVATDGIVPLKEAGGHHNVDPHAWQSVPNAKVYVENIRKALAEADPASAEVYRTNAERYAAQLDALDRDIRAMVARIPQSRRKVISTHEAFGYFAAAYGVTLIAPQGVSTDAEPSARDLAAIIAQIRKEKIPAVFLENISDPRLIRRVAAETGARIGGTLYSDSLTDEKGEAPTYIDMVRHNIKTLQDALDR
ncbi:MAG: metal ABC transporter substrate-binding protein [Xanthobacteraceae bacterium]